MPPTGVGGGGARGIQGVFSYNQFYCQSRKTISEQSIGGSQIKLNLFNLCFSIYIVAELPCSENLQKLRGSKLLSMQPASFRKRYLTSNEILENGIKWN